MDLHNKDKKFGVRFTYYVDVLVTALNRDDAYQKALAVLDTNKLDDIATYHSSKIHELRDQTKTTKL